MSESSSSLGQGAMPSVELRSVTKSYGDASLESNVAVKAMNLRIFEGEFFTFLGPSGCGKTTTLRLIAGFEEPTAGSILLDGQDMVGTPAFRRNTNTVFQSYALFPHLNVMQNVEFGLAVKGKLSGAKRREKAAAALDMVRMGHAADRKPAELSGGQQQRIALARAIVNEPRVLLLDEPFGALDLKLRREMQIEVKEMQRRLGITFIFVTHDQEEALTMSDRIAVMSDGCIRQVDDPVGIYERPVDRFTADFIGDMNMLDAVVEALDAETVTVRAGGSRFTLPRPAEPISLGDKLTVAMRPEALSLGVDRDGMVVFEGISGDTIYIGTDRSLQFTTSDGDRMQIRIRNRLGGVASPGRGVSIAVGCPPAAIHLLTK